MAKRKKPKGKSLASQADRYRLYLEAVQSPDNEVPFFNRVFRSAYGRPPLLLREDFCGTAAVCCEWVKSHRDRRAVGIDLDPEPLAWGKTHTIGTLTPEAAARVKLVKGNVLKADGEKADVLAAQNFSFFFFNYLNDY